MQVSEKRKNYLLKFSSITQGLKALEYINSNENFRNLEAFKNFINLENRNEMWLSAGRTLGEKSFIILEKGNPTAFGFYELYSQIKSEKSISKLKIPVEIKDIDNELKLALVKNEFTIQPNL